MRILFDQATPEPLRRFLTGHSVRTAHEEGWSQLRNGDLLTAAELAGFELFVTTDRNIRYQQNLAGRNIAIIVPGKQQWPVLRAHTQIIVAAIATAAPASFLEIEIP